MKPFIFLLI